jgi:hypothetical protein
MQRPALDFGDSGVVRCYCDACSKPLIVAHRGRAGDYCSRACLEGHDAERAKVKMPQAPKVKTTPAEKVKIPLVEKVKIAPPPKVKIVPPEKVKISPTPVPAPKVKIQGRAAQRSERRAAIQSIRREMLKDTEREPTIAEVQSRLSPLGLAASVRTVWIDLSVVRGKT